MDGRFMMEHDGPAFLFSFVLRHRLQRTDFRALQTEWTLHMNEKGLQGGLQTRPNTLDGRGDSLLDEGGSVIL